MDAPKFDPPPELRDHTRAIRHVSVLGAGVMGAQIAALFANAGVPVLLLDLTAKAAKEGLDRARKLKPDPFVLPDTWTRIEVGGFDPDLPKVQQSDWILEAIVEKIEPKRELLARLEPHRHSTAIVSSNTSGIPIAALVEGRSEAFRRHWLGTHFFNPPRYLRLLEVIPAPWTDADVLSAAVGFADRHLGKGVVLAKDSPSFIGNRIGLFGIARILNVLASGRYTVEEIDDITGPVLGRPKSATLRTVDIAGLDILADVAAMLAARLDTDADRESFVLPPFVRGMLEKGWLGEKAGQGFYRRQTGPSGDTEILTLDPASLTFRPRQTPALPPLEAARRIDDQKERIRTLWAGQDRVGALLRETLGPTLLYTARIAPDIAYSIDDIDRVMRWGFAWDLGPFELWDAIGIREVMAGVAQACPEVARDLPPLAQAAVTAGRNGFRVSQALPPAGPSLEILRTAKDRGGVVKRNPGASLVDVGDGVLVVEFHSKMNTIGADTLAMLQTGVDEASRNFAALIVGNDAPNFSAGANLMLLLLEAQEGNWEDIDLMVRSFQATTMALKCADVPVVVAPAGLTLGGGCEIMLHGGHVQASAETYVGLVEAGVGLIPAAGGTKEMLLRSLDGRPAPTSDPLPFVQRAFETIGFARVSTSGADARRLGLLREHDAITANRDRLIADAKARALELVREGYQRPVPRKDILAGGEGMLAALTLAIHLAERGGRISAHDALIGRKLAGVLSGGALPHATVVPEQYVLDLEREAFLSLCGEPKTHDRIRHTLKTGKTLRN